MLAVVLDVTIGVVIANNQFVELSKLHPFARVDIEVELCEAKFSDVFRERSEEHGLNEVLFCTWTILLCYLTI